MVIELLFSAAVGAGVTHKLIKRIDEVELDSREKKYQQACDYHLEGNLKQAISILEDLIKKDRYDPRYYIQLWCSYGKLATNENMKENLEKALENYEIVYYLVNNGAFVPDDILKMMADNTVLMKSAYQLIKTNNADNRRNLARKPYSWREDIQKYRCEYCLLDGKYHYCKTLKGIKRHILNLHPR
jgi:tetratricopeptide (TPR) repeat protein